MSSGDTNLVPSWPGQQDNGGPTRPFHLHSTPIAKADKLDLAEEEIRQDAPFRGRWQTYITEDYHLLVPQAYLKVLEHGGIITASTQRHLLLFGAKHWERLERMISSEIGINPDRHNLARHMYLYSEQFNGVGEDGKIQLSKKLVDYAKIKRDVAIVGLVYLAEVHAMEDYHDIFLDEDAISALAKAFK